MPLFFDNTHSAAMIKHAMIAAKNVIQYLNPAQTPVLTMDQPLFSWLSRYNGLGQTFLARTIMLWSWVACILRWPYLN